MSDNFKKFLKIAFPILLGSFIIYLFYKQLDAKSIAVFQNHFKKANYWWVLAATTAAFISHVSRAMRWQMMMKSLGYSLGFMASLNSIFVNYLVNLGIPRTGELARCGVLSQYYNIPFDKSFGALVNERVIDVILLAVVGLLTLVFQRDIFISFMKKYLYPFIEKTGLLEKTSNILILGFVLLALGLFVLYLISKGKFPLQAKFSKLFGGIKEGLLSIMKLENPALFIAHSLFIWLMYWLMIYLVFYAVPGGSDITAMAALSILFFGTFAFLAVSGGFGAYPVMMGIVVSLYGLDAILGNAVGWLLWGGQTLMIVVFGIISFFMLSLVKTNKPETKN